ncbi:hypothetical protein VNI00_000889 [Paramarasmius palmivorus]|uniref:WD40 repeat-like protein n=1 Tax=Paramarasmius palmivorus TaxID=297713 RepID=A0AAW0E5P0_9AGAR
MPDPILIPAPSFRVSSQPLSQTTLPSNTYVLGITNLPGQNRYVVSTSSPSSNAIQIYDKSTLRVVKNLEGHQQGTTYLRFVEGTGIMSSGKDGLIKVWDERLSKFTSPNTRPILSFDVSSSLVAGGTALQGEDALVLFWDTRNASPSIPLRTHSSTHSDDITALHFSSSNKVLSASSDGLISLSNPLEDDEDEAVEQMANWGCSISQCGFYDSGIWAASDMETFSLWNAELDPNPSLNMDVRAPSVHTGGKEWVTDYLIGCSTGSGGLKMFVGSNEGDVGLITPSEEGQWTLHSVWSYQHEGVVRSVLWDQETGNLVTGGEDAKLTVWPTQNVDLEDTVMGDIGTSTKKREHGDDMDVDDEERGGKKQRR